MNNEELIDGKPREFYKVEKVEKDSITYTLKSDKELLEENLISQDEYNKRINKERETLYESKTDKQVIELTRSFLNRNINNLTEEEKAVLNEINNTVTSIKQEYPKQN
ncbi:hypothetical protein [uncultured Brachyspira sp.]|uniref:hypothetical protein n=1 Tax=uncultured Brachyspira sp. TaxID=221953 RepID=UPI0026244FCA|nr:hypothetical protein [uncultured Brachyspira sp.]